MREKTDLMSNGECTFEITMSNECMLKALTKYAEMLDFATNSEGEEKLNIDGLINYLLDGALESRIKEIVKRHGFESRDDFIEEMTYCHDAEEVRACIKNKETQTLKAAHDAILAHIPLDDKQARLPL